MVKSIPTILKPTLSESRACVYICCWLTTNNTTASCVTKHIYINLHHFDIYDFFDSSRAYGQLDLSDKLNHTQDCNSLRLGPTANQVARCTSFCLFGHLLNSAVHC